MIHWLYKYKMHHILFWVAYFVFWTIMSMRSYNSSLASALPYTAIWFAGQAACAYAGMYWLVPRFFNTHRYLPLFAGYIMVLVLGSAFIVYGVSSLSLRHNRDAAIEYGTLSFYVLMANFYTSLCMMAAKIVKEKLASDQQARKREKEQMQHELSFLRSQMNPHFLFNAINSIYVLIRKDPEAAAQTLARFSDMLRYQLYECNTEYIAIEKEISYLGHYLALEQLRRGNTLRLQYSISSQVANFSIAPLLLIAFIENAFKYLSTNGNGENYIRIALYYEAPFFTLEVENSKDETPVPNGAPGGIGQLNVRRRLELAYPGRHTLQLADNGKNYVVSLRIQVS